MSRRLVAEQVQVGMNGTPLSSSLPHELLEVLTSYRGPNPADGGNQLMVLPLLREWLLTAHYGIVLIGYSCSNPYSTCSIKLCLSLKLY